MPQLRLRIADVLFAFASRDPAFSLCVPPPAEAFVVEEDGAVPDLLVEARYDDLSRLDPGRVIFDSSGTWRLHERSDAEQCFVFHSDAFGAVPYKMAFVGRTMDRVDVRLHRGYFATSEPRYPLEHPLDELLMLNLLATRHGVEVHSSGVVDTDGRGRLFVGMSGAGKSTISSLWLERRPSVTILSDDRIVLRRQGGRMWMHGTPWHGEAHLSAPASAPLEHVYFLRQASANRTVPVDGAAAVARLLACTFAPFHSAPGIAAAMAFLDELVHTVPCSELSFVRDASVIDSLTDSLTGADS